MNCRIQLPNPGTERLRTNYLGQAANTQRFVAFGDGFAQTTNDPTGSSQDNSQFTGQEYDAGSNTDDFLYRPYAPNRRPLDEALTAKTAIEP